MKGRNSTRDDIFVRHYRSFYEAALQLPSDSDRLAFYIGIDEYRFEGRIPDSGSSALKVALTLAKSRIDADERASRNGSKGGAPKGNRNAAKKQPGCQDGCSKKTSRGETNGKKAEPDESRR